MSYVEFYKYHGAGNDFILIDNRSNTLTLTTETIAQWCHRNYGVGADGLMLLEAPNDINEVQLKELGIKLDKKININ